MEDDRPKIEASFIIEMMGKPAEHLSDTLRRLIEKLGTEKGVNIVGRKIHEPKEVEQNNEQIKIDEKIKDKIKNGLKGEGKMEVLSDIFTTFAEVDAEFDSLESLLFIAFNYMPSHIQITKPENFFIRNEDLDVLLTNIILRLHRYDEIAKRITIKKAILENKLKELTDKKKSYK